MAHDNAPVKPFHDNDIAQILKDSNELAAAALPPPNPIEKKLLTAEQESQIRVKERLDASRKIAKANTKVNIPDYDSNEDTSITPTNIYLKKILGIE